MNITTGARRLANRIVESFSRRPAAEDRRQATLDALAALADRFPARPGFYIDEIEDAVRRAPGTLYADLTRLEDDGEVTATWLDVSEVSGFPNHLRRTYRLTEPERSNP